MKVGGYRAGQNILMIFMWLECNNGYRLECVLQPTNSKWGGEN